MDGVGGQASRRITVVLADMPALVSEMLRRALRGADVNVVELRDPQMSLDAAVGDVLIVPSESVGIRALYRHVLREHPAMRMLTLAASGDRADLYELRLVGSDVGVDGVVAAVLSAAHRVH